MINYYLLTKPGIILGNLITVVAGFMLASHGPIDIRLLLATLLGLSLIMASACVWNNYIDRPVDKKMSRTKNRALVIGLITEKQAIVFATALGIAGSLFLYLSTNVLTLGVALTGFFVYVILYSLWKCRTIYGTAIGSIAGAVPPVVGYCAVSNRLDEGAMILFLMMVLWQMPHFFSIAIYHYEDYAAADIPVLPVKKGMKRTKVHMAFYIIGFIIASLMLTFYHYTGMFYLYVALGCGLSWLWLCMKGFQTASDHLWSRQMFRLSLVLITLICLTIPFDQGP